MFSSLRDLYSKLKPFLLPEIVITEEEQRLQEEEQRLQEEEQRLREEQLQDDLFRQQQLEIARNMATAPVPEVFLFVTHQWGGGIERHINDMTALVHRAGGVVVIARPTDEGHMALQVVQDHQERLCTFKSAWGAPVLAQMVQAMGVNHLHVHSLVNYPHEMSDLLLDVCALNSLSLDVTLHDYIPVCPRIHLMDAKGMYCGEPDLAGCEACIARNGSHFGQVSVADWRARHQRLLFAARAVFAPNSDVVTRYQRYFPQLRIIMKPHIEIKARPIRVALIGTLSPHKGMHILMATARAARRASLPLRFIIIGKSDNDAEIAAIGNVEIMGAYQDQDLPELIAKARPDLVWFAATGPETYSYTFSAALDAGMTSIAFDIGAIAERIRALGSGHLIPWADVNDPHAIIQALFTASGDPLRGAAQWLSDYYNLEGDGSSRRFFQA